VCFAPGTDDDPIVFCSFHSNVEYDTACGFGIHISCNKERIPPDAVNAKPAFCLLHAKKFGKKRRAYYKLKPMQPSLPPQTTTADRNARYRQRRPEAPSSSSTHARSAPKKASSSSSACARPERDCPYGCGKKFKTDGWYNKHVSKCDRYRPPTPPTDIDSDDMVGLTT